MKSITFFCCVACWFCVSDAFLFSSSRRQEVKNPIGFRNPSTSHYHVSVWHRISHSHLCVLQLTKEKDDGVPDTHGFGTIRELLAELDKRNIRYPPTATRQELERLLNSGQNVSNQIQVAWLAEQLLAMGIRIPRYASRDDLERLLQDALQNPDQVNVTQRSESQQLTKQRKRQHITIARLRKELDELGIPYPPGASPRVLERLLREQDFYPEASSSASASSAVELSEPIGRPPKDPSSPRARRSKRPSAVEPSEQDNPHSRDFLPEVNRRKTRVSATAIRQEELQELFNEDEQQASDPLNDTTNNVSQSGNETLGTSESTAADDGYDSHNDQTTSLDQKQEIGKSQPIANTEEALDREVQVLASEGIQDDLHDIQETNEQGPSRRRAAGSSQQPEVDPSERKKVYSGRRVGTTSRDRVRLSRQNHWADVYHKGKDIVVDTIFRTIPGIPTKTLNGATSRLSRAAELAARKARYAARRAKDFFVEDEFGIRDADYEYVGTPTNVIIDVPAEAVVQERTNRSAARRHERYKHVNQRQNVRKGSRNVPSPEEPRYRQSNQPPPRGRSRVHVARKPTNSDPAARSNLFRLPPAKSASASEESTSHTSPQTKQRRRRSNSEKDANRRIYTPYSDDDAASQVYRDAFDKVGEFLVNMADTILWGGTDDVEEELLEEKKAAPRASSTKGKKKEHHSVNWKDRMEDRFDAMLGIHKEGEYYNRWAVQEEQDEGGYDAFSVAQGRSPKKRHQPRSKAKNIYDKPLWERGNLLSILFGRSPPAGFDSVGVGKILPSIRTLAKTLVLVATHACEWASVRGSLPQPVVVVGVTSCVLSVGHGKRLLTLVLSLVAFRIFGELIHEGLYGHEDWDFEEKEVEDALGDGQG